MQLTERQRMTTSEVFSEQLCIRVDPRTRARLEAEAERDRRPLSAMARVLIADGLADRERQGAREARP
jgi:hypothetical protein